MKYNSLTLLTREGCSCQRCSSQHLHLTEYVNKARGSSKDSGTAASFSLLHQSRRRLSRLPRWAATRKDLHIYSRTARRGWTHDWIDQEPGLLHPYIWQAPMSMLNASIYLFLLGLLGFLCETYASHQDYECRE
jgi:hypothetical protein